MGASHRMELDEVDGGVLRLLQSQRTSQAKQTSWPILCQLHTDRLHEAIEILRKTTRHTSHCEP